MSDQVNSLTNVFFFLSEPYAGRIPVFNFAQFFLNHTLSCLLTSQKHETHTHTHTWWRRKCAPWLTFRSHARGYKHLVQVVFYLTGRPHISCVGSTITMLPLSATHQPCQGCKTGSKRVSSRVGGNAEYGHTLNTLQTNAPCNCPFCCKWV